MCEISSFGNDLQAGNMLEVVAIVCDQRQLVAQSVAATPRRPGEIGCPLIAIDSAQRSPSRRQIRECGMP